MTEKAHIIIKKAKQDLERTIQKFLEEYEQICKKYGIYIEGCGCCDSPYLVILGEDSELKKNIEHLKKTAKNLLQPI